MGYSRKLEIHCEMRYTSQLETTDARREHYKAYELRAFAS